MTVELPRVNLENGATLTPKTVARSANGRWVSCIYDNRVERVPTQRVLGITEAHED
jgi:hypothetical protein